MKRSFPSIARQRRAVLIAVIIVAAATTLAVATVSSAEPAARAQGGDLTVWLSGTYANATPGSTYRKWVDGIAARYKKANPGSKVKFVLTPINNAQFTAQIAAAFASRRVPDAMLVYSGGYTTPYMLSSLEKLNDRVDKAFYASQTQWNLSCLDLDCKGGKGAIYGIPNDFGTYALYYLHDWDLLDRRKEVAWHFLARRLHGSTVVPVQEIAREMRDLEP